MNQIIINIAYSFAIIVLLSTSITLLYLIEKVFDITTAFSLGVGAYLVYQMNVRSNLAIVIFLAVISVMFFDLLKKKISSKIFNRNLSPSFYFMLITLGLYMILQNLISIIWGDEMKILRVDEVKIGHELWGAYITDVQIITLSICALCVVFNLLFLKYARIGIRIKAVSTNQELAKIQGINSDRVILWATGIGSGMAAIAGILVGFDTGLTPTMGFNLLLYGIVAMIIGGVGSTKGLIGGAFLLAAAQHLTAYYIDSKWMNAITYIILIVFLIWRPLGFSGQRLKKIEI